MHREQQVAPGSSISRSPGHLILGAALLQPPLGPSPSERGAGPAPQSQTASRAVGLGETEAAGDSWPAGRTEGPRTGPTGTHVHAAAEVLVFLQESNCSEGRGRVWRTR